MKLAVDAMGGDYAPKQIVLGAIEAAKNYDCEIVLVGDKPQIEAELKANNALDIKNIEIHHTTEIIEMGEHPVDAVRKKKDSSLVVATKLVKNGEYDAVLSAGSTGAASA